MSVRTATSASQVEKHTSSAYAYMKMLWKDARGCEVTACWHVRVSGRESWAVGEGGVRTRVLCFILRSYIIYAKNKTLKNCM